jgi:hypothetical protein
MKRARIAFMTSSISTRPPATGPSSARLHGRPLALRPRLATGLPWTRATPSGDHRRRGGTLRRPKGPGNRPAVPRAGGREYYSRLRFHHDPARMKAAFRCCGRRRRPSGRRHRGGLRRPCRTGHRGGLRWPCRTGHRGRLPGPRPAPFAPDGGVRCLRAPLHGLEERRHCGR